MRKHTIVLLLLSFVTNLTSFAQEYIPMKKEASGTYTIPCQVNGLKLRFILDTGASTVTLSMTEANFMYKNGYLEDSDIIGTEKAQLADGSITENAKIHLKTIQIGSVTLKDVEALVVNNDKAPLLLGQSVLGRLGSWSIDGDSFVLSNVISPTNGDWSTTINKAKELIDNDEREAGLNLLKPAMKAGIKEANYLYGIHMDTDDDNQTDNKTCLNNLIKMSDDGDVEASNVLGFYYTYKETSKYLAIKYLEKTNGHRDYASNCWQIGNFYEEDGRENKAVEYYKKSFELGYKFAACSLGFLYDNNGDFPEAIKWYEKAIASGVSDAYQELADFYLKGRGVPKNISKGIELLSVSGNHDCYFDLVKYYLFGKYVNKNLTLARKWNNKLMMAYGYRAVYYLVEGLIDYDEKNFHSAVENFKQGFSLFAEPLTGMRIDSPFIKSQSYITLGLCYKEGKGMTERNGFEAKNCFENAIEEGDSQAFGFLGDLFVTDELFERNYEIAFNYYKQGANNEDSYCCYKVGIFYKEGVYVEQNVTEGQRWINKAKSLGYVE